MSKAQSCVLGDNHDSGIGTEKESEASGKELPRRQPRPGKVSFKSLTALSARDSLESLQKMRRRSDGSRRSFFNRSPCSSAEKRVRKKFRKRFEKPNVSELNIRKVTGELAARDKDKLVSVVSPRRLGGNGEESARKVQEEVAAVELLQRLGQLRLAEAAASTAQNPGEANGAIEYGSGDVALGLELGSGDGSCYGDADQEDGMACAHVYDSKRRSVQWKREVDVIYYAGDADGGRVVRRENEPLREEADQQARNKKFIQMALTKSSLSNVSACQLRDPWLVVLPK